MTTQEPESTIPISERVRFWEEQDRINKELIPRVIRQHELLTRHIAEHQSLPEVVAKAVHDAVTAARAQQEREFAEEVNRIQSGISRQVEETVGTAMAAATESARRTRTLVIVVGSVAVLAGIAGLALSAVAVFAG
jgi:CHASE3 domain sensor protein